MIEEIKKEIEEAIEEAIEDGQPYVYNETLNSILDKYNNQQEYKWKCDICGTGFNNFQAQGFDNKIYCPLCYFKKELTNYKNAWEDLYNKNLMLKTPNMKLLQLEMQELEQKYDLGE